MSAVFPKAHRAEDFKERRGFYSSTEGAVALYKSREETTRGKPRAAVVCQGGYVLQESIPRGNYFGKGLSRVMGLTLGAENSGEWCYIFL